ncbi:transcriptional regulator [Pseudonocardia sp. HH130630-07]|uniref:transcriptional regulator n=1 Tax=Pseudonocardia sp. HH130630-07 TaxID=1690815 RepID=UPI00081502F5|nr:transcriptional regulator [Pseudonocardia sp. HH130630-07]ANY06650.1 hypothetical protein AFB00_10475 [Pseudonocardia sp. HH130630-07]
MTAGERHPVLETRPRLALCALLQGAKRIEFSALCGLAGIGDYTAHQHSRSLADAGLLEIRTGRGGQWARTWLRLSPSGRAAFRDHLAWLGSP